MVTQNRCDGDICDSPTRCWARAFVVFVCFICAVHVVLTVGYHTPDNPLKGAVKPVFDIYFSAPLLEQRFSFFAPIPESNSLKFVYRYRYNDKWSDWIGPGGQLLQGFYISRVTSQNQNYWLHDFIGRSLMLRKNSLGQPNKTVSERGLNRDIANASELDSLLKDSEEYKLACRYISALALLHSAKAGLSDVREVEFSSVLVPVKRFSERRNAAFSEVPVRISYPSSEVVR